jgi:hypothetical protein
VSQKPKAKDYSHKVQTFINPLGIIEQHYIGLQSPQSILYGLDQLRNYVGKITDGDDMLILADISQVPEIDVSKRMLPVRKAALDLMKSLNYKKAALYGPLPMQTMINVLSLVAGTHSKIRTFDERPKAIRWLRS